MPFVSLNFYDENFEAEKFQPLKNLVEKTDWERLVELACLITGKKEFLKHEIVLSFVSAKEIQNLNDDFRGKDKPTDVLSFNYRPTGSQENEDILGDVIVCTEVAIKQAKEHGYKIGRELIFLFVHGVLHLLGYDHEDDPVAAEEMFSLQRQVLREFGIKEEAEA